MEGQRVVAGKSVNVDLPVAVTVGATSVKGTERPLQTFFSHLLPEPPTYFYVRLIDGVARIFFLTPMPRPGFELTSVELHWDL